MKFIFKEQKYQVEAVKAVADVFQGQPYTRLSTYTRDVGRLKAGQIKQMTLFDGQGSDFSVGDDYDYSLGFANSPIQLDNEQIINNIQVVQGKANLAVDNAISQMLSPLDLDVEMETGTGKTYVYIRTMFELNKQYGFSKFIVVVPSIAIREGVKKSFEQTQDHFMSIYGKKARFFIYDSKNLSEIDNFAKSDAINAMIINIQAFNTRGKDARKIYEELDEFQSRRPIDVIKMTRPILILDEPQKMGGEATKSAIGEFNPLFTINYSATHKDHHNLVYVLDALDAYNEKLVKKIEVKGINVKNVKGTQPYIYLDEIILRGSKDPLAKVSFFQNTKNNGVQEHVENLSRGDNLYELSNRLGVYKNNYIIDEIDWTTNRIKFLNGVILNAGEAQGNVSEDLIRRIQIRETIASHIEKEEENFNKGIKTLSLFFIDEVKKYRDYTQPDTKGEYAKIFEDEYEAAVFRKVNDLCDTNEAYKNYLMRFKPEQVHKGYFSVDKKGNDIDSKENRKTGYSDDESAYDLILKNKERLLSFEEPTRFIFSHSALAEGWDNPNVFQICTLRYTKSTIKKRQEVGRGLRICVDKNGNRQDTSVLNDFFDVNKLTVVANEEYEDFVKGLQNEISEVLYERPSRADKAYFVGKTIVNETDNSKTKITDEQARLIYRYLVKNDYVDDKDHLTDKFRNDVADGNTAELPDELKPFEKSIIETASNVNNPSKINIDDGKRPKVIENKVNANFNRPEFQELWNSINHMYTYRVSFSSEELIKNSIESIKKNLKVSKIMYSVRQGSQKDTLTKEQIQTGTGFTETKSSGKMKIFDSKATMDVKYDLVHEIAERTNLTRKTIVAILVGTKEMLQFYRDNPEEYMNKVSALINEQKAAVIVNHVTYNQIDGTFDSDIFNEKHAEVTPTNHITSKKAIQDYVFVDGNAKNGDSVELAFAKQLEIQDNVKVYAKMPKGFYIPTPMGKYSPDWAIVYEDKDSHEKGIYFIAETKGSLNTLQLRKVEEVKIDCAKDLYNRKGSKVHYGKVHSYNDLVNEITNLSISQGVKNN